MRVTSIAAALLAAAWAAPAHAQFARQTYPLDIGSATPITGTLPFDEQFVFSGTAAPELELVRVTMARSDRLTTRTCTGLLELVERGELRAAIDSLRGVIDDLAKRRDPILRRWRERASEPAGPERDEALKRLAEEDEALAAPEREARLRRQTLLEHPLTPGDPRLPSLARNVGQGSWTRTDTMAKTFTVLAGPLDPNVRYSICVQSVRTLTKEELTKFREGIAAGLSSQVAEILSRNGDLTIDTLRALQRRFADAVPKRRTRTVGYASDDALLRPRDLSKESREERDRRDSLLAVRFGALLLLGQERTGDTLRITQIGRFVTDALVELDGRHHTAMRALTQAELPAPRTRDERERAQEERARFARARRLATTLSNPGGAPRAAELRLVGRGAVPINDLDVGRPDPPFGRIVNAAQLVPFAANLDSSAARLRELRDFAARVEAVDDRTLARLGATRGQVAALHRAIVVALQELARQRLAVASLGERLTALQAGIHAVVATLSAADANDVLVVGTTETDYVSNAKRYISADFGLLYAFGFPRVGEFDGQEFSGGAVAPYLGANFYFRAVNKNASLKLCRGLCMSRRFSITLGLTTNGIKRERVRDDLFGSQSALLAAGLRLTDYLRFTGGGLVFKSFASNGGEQVTMAPATSLSLDYDIRGALGSLFGALFPKQP